MSKVAVQSFVLALGLCAAATAVVAQTRPSSPNLSCAQARQLVLSQGAVVLGTGGFTYDRFVRDGGFCERGEYPSAAWVRTRATPQCPVGYRCRSGPPNEFGN
jgi:hypothetical protein